MHINPILSTNSYVSKKNAEGKKSSFKARALGVYKYLADRKRDVIVYQLEKRDINYLDYIWNHIGAFFEKYQIYSDITQEIFEHSLEAGIILLQDILKKESKAKVLLALSGDDPSAILIGNALKIDKKGRYHFSSRKNHAKFETELDGLATWNSSIPNEGKAIFCEYCDTLIEDGFKSLYIRSEIPQNSSARDFYCKMGLEPLSETERSIQRRNDYDYVSGIFEYNDDLIIPMKATVSDLRRTLEIQGKKLKRTKIKDAPSIKLPSIEL